MTRELMLCIALALVGCGQSKDKLIMLRPGESCATSTESDGRAEWRADGIWCCAPGGAHCTQLDGVTPAGTIAFESMTCMPDIVCVAPLVADQGGCHCVTKVEARLQKLESAEASRKAEAHRAEIHREKAGLERCRVWGWGALREDGGLSAFMTQREVWDEDREQKLYCVPAEPSDSQCLTCARPMPGGQ